MKAIYVLTFIKTGEQHFFTNLISIFIKFDTKTLRVKYNSMGHYNFSEGDIYENAVIQIKKANVYNKNDVIRENPARQHPD